MTCTAPWYTDFRNLPPSVAARPAPTVASRSSVRFSRSRATVSAVNAAAKNTNITRYPGMVKSAAFHASMSPTSVTWKSTICACASGAAASS